MQVLKSWTRRRERQVDALEVTAGRVYVACYEGDDCSALGCSHADFTGGKLHAVVADLLGAAVLAEALAFVRAEAEWRAPCPPGTLAREA